MQEIQKGCVGILGLVECVALQSKHASDERKEEPAHDEHEIALWYNLGSVILNSASLQAQEYV